MLNSNKSTGRLLTLDPRTVLLLIVIGNVCIYLTPNMISETLLMLYAFVLALLSGVYRFSIRLMAAFFILVALDTLMTNYFDGQLTQTIALGCRHMRKILPCAMLGGILVFAVQVSEFMAALSRLRAPRSILIPMTIMLRYLPAVAEDYKQIKRAQIIRGTRPELYGFFKRPLTTLEAIYVPLLMSASRRGEELSSAAITRGIENPAPRTSLHEIRFGVADVLCLAATLMWSLFIVRFG